jgi:large subunit ribosomal protein L23
MKTKYEVILKPVITEKSYEHSEKGNIYTFRVHSDANKVQIKQAVEEIFKAKRARVLSVSTINVKGRRRGRVKGKRGMSADWKKALVTIDRECKLDIY